MKTSFKQTEIGKIPEDWELKTAEEFCSKVTDGTHDSPKQKDEGKYLITSKHLKQNTLDFQGAYLISEGDFKEINKRSSVEQFDVIFSMIGTVGETYQEKEKTINYAIKNVGLFKFNQNKIKSDWFFYWLKSAISQEYIESRKSGSTQQYLTLESLRKFPVVFPKILSEQQSIASILSSLDAKIELNNKMNKTLEAIGQAIFKKWFIDNPEKEEWKEGKLGDFVDLEKGLSYKGSGLTDDKTSLPMANLGTFNLICGFKQEGIKHYCGEYKKRNLVKPGDLLIANTDMTQDRNILGSPAIIPPEINSERVLFTHHTYAVRHKENLISNYFLYFLLQTSEYRERAIGFATGTTVLALPKEAVLEMNFLLPNRELLKKFDGIISEIFFKISNNNQQSRYLSQTRDALLPKLMNGEIRVPIK